MPSENELNKEALNHQHEHGEGCGCGHHHHDHEHGEGCGCGHHHIVHEHGEGCGCGHHHHDHENGEGCGCGHHHHDHEPEHGLTINFDGEINSDINTVWEILTSNEYVEKWSDGLRFTDYRPGGTINYQDENNYMILDIEAPTLLTFTWTQGTIAIELNSEIEDRTMINFSHWIEEINDETAVHLTNWMINLQTIAALSEKIEIEDRSVQYNEILPRMREMLKLDENEFVEFE